MTERQHNSSAVSLTEKIWYGRSVISWLLVPFSVLYAAVISVRRMLYMTGIIRSRKFSVPVVVVGNITSGGTGKTPVTLWLARELARNNLSPGIVMRGYRGKVGASPIQVASDSHTDIVGDEALLLARRSGCPVVVHPDRAAAAEKLISLGVDIVIADDGLQHYHLARDVELAVVDGARRFGNGRLLPSGPLRESMARLVSVDEVLVHGKPADVEETFSAQLAQQPRYFQLSPLHISRLDESDVRPLEAFSGKTLHAVAGIGNPERFFSMLESFGIDVVRHPLADHARIAQSDLMFSDQAEIVMTEKDAVKCGGLKTANCWYVPVELVIDDADKEALMRTIELKTKNIAVSGGRDQ